MYVYDRFQIILYSFHQMFRELKVLPGFAYDVLTVLNFVSWMVKEDFTTFLLKLNKNNGNIRLGFRAS